MSRLRDHLSLVRFSHSVFALPFALQGAWLASRGIPPWITLVKIIVCAVAARTAAMSFNRIVDRKYDAQNPRTRSRELPAGRLSVASVRALVLVSSTVFVIAAFSLNTLSGSLSLPVLALLFFYSYVKRFSVAAHAFLGLALALAPLGAWVAVRGEAGAGIAPVVWLACAVLTWVSGFDLIYACQDAEFDARVGLHSLPARFGIAAALRISSVLHVATVACLVLVGTTAELSFIYWAAVAVAAVLLAWEHSLVKADDLSRVDVAFFTINGWVGVGLFLGLALDRGVFGRSM